jgi:hypothetical protein
MSFRHSPVTFTNRPLLTDTREGWKVVLQYEDEGGGPFLIDLSHLFKWDLQHRDLSQIKPAVGEIPESPGYCVLSKGMLTGRLNRTQAMVWHLTTGRPEMPLEQAVTDVTDAHALFALVGKELFSIMEKITPLDLSAPGKAPPFLLQGPVLHLPVKIVVLGDKGDHSALLVACTRGYGQSLADAILDAGTPWGLHPAGEKAFSPWMKA